MSCINITPDPPIAGQGSTVGFTGSLPKMLQVEFTPPGDPSSVTVPAEGVGDLDIPEGTTDIVISDPDESCTALVRAVSGGGG